MTELTDRDPMRADTDWLVGDEPLAADTVTAAPGSGRRTALTAVGLVAAGLLVGGVGVAALRPNSSSNNATPTGFRQGQLPNGQLPNGQIPNGQIPNGQIPNGQIPNGQIPNGQIPNGQLQGGQGLPGQGGIGGSGGVDGEQRVSGTVVSVGSSSVRIRTSSGTASYGVTSQSEIVRNGSLVALSSIKPGDTVFVHLIPSSGSSYVVERLFATATTSGDASNGTTGSTSTGDAT